MLHLTIQLASWDDESDQAVPTGTVIDERDITLGEALELVIGDMMQSIGNVGTTIQRTRVRMTEGMEVAFSYEYYLGKGGLKHWDKIPDNWYLFWYSFTLPQLERRGGRSDQAHLMTLYDATMTYFQVWENSGAHLRCSSEVQRHIERIKRRRVRVA